MAARILDFFSLDCFEPFRTAETCEEYPARAEVQNWLMWPPVYTLPVAAIVAASRCLRPVPALGPGPEPASGRWAPHLSSEEARAPGSEQL